MQEHCYQGQFQYTHDNPYHERLSTFSDFVLRDTEGEQHKGHWNKNIFKRQAELCVEIGSGHGDFMMEYCQKNPDHNFVGLDYRFKRTFTLAKKLAAIPNKNFCFLRARGERIGHLFESAEVERLFYFFPDPWPKNRHHKKRLFQDHFLAVAFNILKSGGKIYIKTDHDDYAAQMLQVIEKSPLFTLTYHSQDLWADGGEPFLTSFSTKFEKIFLSKGIKIKAFVIQANK